MRFRSLSRGKSRRQALSRGRARPTLRGKKRNPGVRDWKTRASFRARGKKRRGFSRRVARRRAACGRPRTRFLRRERLYRPQRSWSGSPCTVTQPRVDRRRVESGTSRTPPLCRARRGHWHGTMYRTPRRPLGRAACGSSCKSRGLARSQRRASSFRRDNGCTHARRRRESRVVDGSRCMKRDRRDAGRGARHGTKSTWSTQPRKVRGLDGNRGILVSRCARHARELALRDSSCT